MKKITLILFALIGFSVQAQIGIISGLNSTALPTGFTITSGGGYVDETAEGLQVCEGTHSWGYNLYIWAPNFALTSPNMVGASNGTDVEVSFQWYAVEYEDLSGVGLSFKPQFSLNNGTTWQDIGTAIVSNSNSECETFSATIPAASVPVASDFKFRIVATQTSGDFFFIVDNISVKQATVNPPSCVSLAFPLNGAVNVLSQIVTWPIAGGATGYKLSAGTTDGGTDLLNMQDVGNVTNYDLGELVAGETYYVTVVPYSENGDATACTSSSFTTCGTSPLPWNEGFEDLAGTVGPTLFPGCWKKENGDWRSSVNSTSTYDSDAHTGTHFITNAYTATDEFIWTPGFQLTAGESYDFSFWYASYGTYDTWNGSVFYNTTQSSVDAFELGSPFISTGTVAPSVYTQVTNTFVPEESGVYYFAIRINVNGSPWYLSFDDFKLELTPSCSAPTAIISDTSTITDTTATISWEESVSSPANGYQYIVTSTNTAPLETATPTGSVAAGLITADLVELVPGSPQYVWVRSVCGSGVYSSWGGPHFFTTLCSSVAEFSQNFDATVAFPACWRKVGTSGSAYVQASTAAMSAPNNIYFYSGSATTQAVIALPPVNNASAGTHRLKFRARSIYTVGGKVEVGYLTNAFDASSFVMVESFTTTSLTTYDSFVAELGETPETGYLALRHSGVPSYEVYLDDISWELIPASVPECTIVTATPAVGCGNYPTVLTWEASAGSDGYYLSIGTTPDGAELLNSENIGAVLSYSFVGETSTTYYYSLVPFNNNGPAVGCAEATFVTASGLCACVPPYTYGKTDGDLISNIVITGTTLANDTGTSPVNPSYTSFTGQSNYTAELQAGSTYNVNVTVGSYGNQNIAVWIDYNDNAEFEANERVGYTTTSIDAEGTASFSISLACNPALGVHKMRVRDVYNTTGASITPCGLYGYGETEDYDVTITAAVACPQPSALSATVTAESATLNWNIGCAETSWDVHVGLAGSGAPTELPSDPGVETAYEKGGLLPSTAYEFYVRANCDTNGYSLWTGPFVFTTNALPPANDFCVNSIALVAGGTFNDNAVQGTNDQATKNASDPIPSEDCDGYNFATNGRDVWYSVLVPESGTITVETAAIASSTMTDTGLEVYSGSCDALVLEGCNADISAVTPINRFSRVTLTGQTPNETLLVRVYGFNTVMGAFMISAYDASLSTGQHEKNTFMAYPNPVKDILNLSGAENISKIEVFNVLGQEVILQNSNLNKVDMSTLSSGTYIVKVTSENQKQILKVIKE